MDKKGIGFVAVLLFLGIVLGGFGFVPVYEHNRAVQEYEPTTATVQSTDIDVRTDDDDKEYSPVVVYEYTVDGETYTEDNVFPGRFERWDDSRSWAADVVDDYEPGDTTEIQYSPHDNGNAYLRNDGWPDSWFLGVGYGVIAGLSGLWLVRVGFKRRKQRELMEDTPTQKVQSVSIGPSEIKGRAVTEEREPGSAPFSDEDCVVAKYEIKEYRDDSDDDGGSWQTIEEDIVHKPFYVQDETGSVLVEPHDDAVYDLDPDDWSETYVDSSNNGPGPIQEFVRSHPDVSFPSNKSGTDNDRKYRQNLIKTDESVYVFGTVHPREEVEERGAANEDRVVVRKVDENGALSEPMYMISDDSEKDLTNRREFALWRLPVGGFFLVIAFGMSLLMFAPMLGLELPVLF